MTTIIAFVGRKGSGKDTCANFLLRNHNELWPNKNIFQYSFAGPLKKICMDLLGLTYEQCYGSNEDKDSMSNIRWENLPHYSDLCDRALAEGRSNPAGLMTAREVLQHVGTEIFRRMNEDCWVNATINKIKEDKPHIALITDCRFMSELVALHDIGGYTIKLTRNPYGGDGHASETAIATLPTLATIDNANMSIDRTNEKLISLLTKWGLL